MRVFLIISMCFLISATAMGAPKGFRCPAMPAKESAAQKKAGMYFSVGEKMAISGAYKKSLQRYLCSLKMKAHPNTMFNIAQVAKLIEKKEPAIQLLKNFCAQNPAHPSVPEINQLIHLMEQGDYDAINPVPPETSVATDEATPVEQEASTPTQNVDMTAAPTPEPENSPPPEHDRQKRKRLLITGVIFIAGGAIATGLGISMTVAASQAKQNGSNATTYSDFQYYDQRQINFTAGAVVSYLIGVAFLTTGIIIYVKTKKRIRQTTGQTTGQPKAAILPAGPGLAISF